MGDYLGRRLIVTGVLRMATVRGKASGGHFVEVESVTEDAGK